MVARFHFLLGLAAMASAASAPAQVYPLNPLNPLDPLAPLPGGEIPPPAPPPRPIIRAAAPVYLPIAPPAVLGWDGYKLVLAARARREGVSEATIAATIPALTRDDRVIRLDRGQPGNVLDPNYVPPFAPYRRDHVTASLVQRGRARYLSLYPQLVAIEARFGVEASVLMAIYGHETSYGAIAGNFDLVRSLATLAYEGRRRELFESETIAALKLLDRGTPRWRLKGSYAGATGYPQFMPSTVLRLATDGDGDGRADIWSDELDGLASIAAYLRNAGWQPGVHWGVAARVPASFDRATVASHLVPPRCPAVFKRHSRFLTIREWRALGVVPTGRGLADTELATLIEPDGRGATAYLVSNNYRAILDYNCSNFYALAIGLIADSIAR